MSSDGKIRSAKVQLSNKTLLDRSLKMVFPLELCAAENQKNTLNLTSNAETLKETKADTEPKVKLMRNAAQNSRNKLRRLLDDGFLLCSANFPQAPLGVSSTV